MTHLRFPDAAGEDESEQIQCMMEILNVPQKDLLDQASRKKLFFEADDEPRITANSHGKMRIPGEATMAEISSPLPLQWGHSSALLCYERHYGPAS